MSDRLLKQSDVIRAIDKRAEELSNDSVFVRKRGYIDVLGIKKHILTIPSADRPQVEWIPCSERLPEIDGHYLCTVTEPQYIDSIYVKFIYWCGRWYGWIPEKVIAWMPLPEPYIEDAVNEIANQRGW